MLKRIVDKASASKVKVQNKEQKAIMALPQYGAAFLKKVSNVGENILKAIKKEIELEVNDSFKEIQL